MRHVKYAILISPYAKKYFHERMKCKTYDIPNPVKSDFFNLNKVEKEKRILFAGSLIRRKGVIDLLKAVNIIKNKVKIDVVLAGSIDDIYYMKMINEYINENMLNEFIHFTGNLNEEQLLKEFKRCSMLILPSYQETAPMVIQQAMAAETPVIASRICGVPYQVDDGETGLLFDPGDIDTLANHILNLINSRGKRERMGKKGKEKALENYHAKEVAAKTEQVYQDIVFNKKEILR